MGLVKGQAEFVIILGIIVVAAIVVIFASQNIFTPPLPSGVAEQHKIVKAHVEGVIKEASISTITELEAHGGYLSDDVIFELGSESTQFVGQPVPYWQKCDNTNNIPGKTTDLVSRIKNRLKTYIINSLDGLTTIEGKQVTFDLSKMRIEGVNILSDKIEIKVNIPTKSAGYDVQQPYSVSLPTKFGHVYDFARDMSLELASERHFETFTIAGMDMLTTLPRFELLTKCGETVFLSQAEISSQIESMISTIVSNTGFWRRTVLGSDVPVFGIQDVNGKTYNDLEISLKLSDDFSVRVLEPIIVVNSEPTIQSSVFPVSPICVTTYTQKYSVSYPVIIKAYDPLLNTDFRFAILVNVDNNRKGTCDSLILTSRCENPQCNARLIVQDGGGSPIPDTDVYIGGCFVNSSSASGIVDGKAPCGDMSLLVYKSPEYEILSENVHVDSVYQRNVNLHRKGNLTLYFSREGSTCNNRIPVNEMVLFNITSLDSDHKFLLTNIDPEFDLDECLVSRGAKEICDTCYQSVADNSYNQSACNICNMHVNICSKNQMLSETKLDYIPGRSYTANLILLNPEKIANYVSTKLSFVAIPIKTKEKVVEIPEEDRKLNLIVPDTDAIYQNAINIYTARAADRRCLAKVFGVCVKHESRAQAEAAAYADATNYLNNNLWNFEFIDCGY